MKDSRPQKFNRKSDEIGGSKSADMKRRRYQKKPNNTTRGFSLERANSSANFYNPALIKKQKEFYKNAKLVSKFKKSIKHESKNNEFSRVGISKEGGNRTENTSDGKEIMNKNTKNKGRKEKLEEEEKERKEKEAHFKAKKEKREEVEARRKATREKMMKKTRRGQPVMKYRIEKLLESIQGSQSNS